MKPVGTTPCINQSRIIQIDFHLGIACILCMKLFPQFLIDDNTSFCVDNSPKNCEFSTGESNMRYRWLYQKIEINLMVVFKITSMYLVAFGFTFTMYLTILTDNPIHQKKMLDPPTKCYHLVI
jgi:hypothetical protein